MSIKLINLATEVGIPPDFVEQGLLTDIQQTENEFQRLKFVHFDVLLTLTSFKDIKESRKVF